MAAEVEDGGWPTLAEVATRLDPSGATIQMANVLSKETPIVRDFPVFEGNLPTGHEIARSSTLPSGTWRLMNQGVVSTKGATRTFTETCGVLEAHSRIDERIVELNGGMAWRATEDALHMEGIAQQLATALIYSNAVTTPQAPHGLAPRFPASTGYNTSGQVQIGTNSGSNCRSVWFVTPAPRKVYLVYPKGTRGGLERNDKGLIPVQDSQTVAGTLFMYLTQLVWRVGLVVEDYRYVVRFQWDPDDPVMAEGEKGLYLALMAAKDKLYKIAPETRIYMDRTTMTRLNNQLYSNDVEPVTNMMIQGGKNIGDAASQGGGEKVPHFCGIPVRVEDSLIAEDAIA